MLILNYHVIYIYTVCVSKTHVNQSIISIEHMATNNPVNYSSHKILTYYYMCILLHAYTTTCVYYYMRILLHVYTTTCVYYYIIKLLISQDINILLHAYTTTCVYYYIIKLLISQDINILLHVYTTTCVLCILLHH